MTRADTIAAIATAAGEAGVAIVRISGPETYKVADRIFRSRGEPPSRRKPFTFAYGTVMDAGEKRIDDVLMLFMRAPRSYTGEDQVEIHGHGGTISSQRILRRVVEAGARLAEPGEFTQRAFLLGRMDLVQAEAVLDLIKARSERAAKAAVEQLTGSLSHSLSIIYDNTIAINADLEATMDFPEDELPEAVMDDILGRLREVQVRADRLLSTWLDGRLLREGALIVIAGCPNVGKSTLMNRLLGQDRAIVSDVPGTTRDTIEEGYLLNGIPLRLVDTAGLRDTACAVEQEGIRRSRDHLRKADITIYMMDAAAGLSADDEAHLKQLEPSNTVIVWNKLDLLAAGVDNTGSCTLPPDIHHFPIQLRLSLRDIEAVAMIRSKLSDILQSSYAQGADQQAVISERHRDILAKFCEHVQKASTLVSGRREDQIPLACAILRDGLEILGTATGRIYHQELLNAIFSRFCIGK